MSSRHEIIAVPDQKLIRLTMGGFFSPAEIQMLSLGMAEAVAGLGCLPNQHVTICDIRDMAIQSQEAVGHFSRLVGAENVRSRKLAFVTTKSLARLQAGRLTNRPDVEFFETIPAAEQWLGVTQPS